MESRSLHATFAYSSIILLVCPALRPLEYSVTFGDLFLLMAILLNADHALKIQPFQIPLLAATPFMTLSQIMDPDATLVEIAQCVYIYGFVLPFGWVAFVGLKPRTLISVLLGALLVNSLVAIGQNAGYIGAIGRGRIWATRDTFRGAGISITCSSLCMTLTPVFPLLLYLKSYRHRIIFLAIISLGMLATLAKSSIFAIPGLLYYLYREPNRTGVLRLIGGMALLAAGAFTWSSSARWLAFDVMTSVSHRLEYLDFSLWERMSTLRHAFSYISECYVLGLGYAGTHYELTQHLGNTVHVFHVGLPLIGGLVCAVLHYIGIFILIRKSRELKHGPLAVMMIGQMLAVCTMPVLMHSFQYIPYMLMGAVIVTAQTAMAKKPVSQPVPVSAHGLIPQGARF